MLNFIRTSFRRWLALARSLFADALAAGRRDGLRAACFEFEVGARTLHAFALGAPIIVGEMLRVTRETVGLRAAWRAGVLAETYVRRRCEVLGVPVGSPTHNVVLAWATDVVSFWESEAGGGDAAGARDDDTISD
ncbi:MAG TPA: hypothetical protein VF659_24245 [Pyrinomonadaceae bacterium]|jgi:hypothetical protein